MTHGESVADWQARGTRPPEERGRTTFVSLTPPEPRRVALGRAEWVVLLVGALVWLSFCLWVTPRVSREFPDHLLMDVQANLEQNNLPVDRLLMEGREVVLFGEVAGEAVYAQVATVASAVPGVRSVRRGTTSSGFLSLRWTTDSLTAEGVVPVDAHAALQAQLPRLAGSRATSQALRRVPALGPNAWQEELAGLESLPVEVPSGVLRFEGNLVSIEGTLAGSSSSDAAAAMIERAFPRARVVNRLRSNGMESRWQSSIDEALAGDRIVFVGSDRELHPITREALQRVADVLLAQPGAQLDIVAHMDWSGDPDADRRRSLVRARSVRDELARQGVSGHRLRTVGVGSSSPLIDGNSTEDRLSNRRIELRARGTDG